MFGRIIFIFLSVILPRAWAGERTIDFGTLDWEPAFQWPDSTPSGCPFPHSRELTGLIFTGRTFHLPANVPAGDTWYPAWAENDTLYSPYTDGGLDGVVSNSAGAGATTGNAVIVGSDPRGLSFLSLGAVAAAPAPYEGRYPAGSLIHKGIWYYSTYTLAPGGNHSYHDTIWNWPILGPTPGFRISTNYGKTWVESPLSPAKPLFPEPAKPFGAVKMGAPHFVDFGKEMEHSPDGKAYLLGMGAEDSDASPRYANLSWISGDQVYLSRVTPSISSMNDISQYEFFAGNDAQGKPKWSSDFGKIKPLLEWNNHMGCVNATYDPALRKYIMCVTDGWPTFAKMDTYILEADEITGPWKIVTYMKSFGQQAYFVNIPSKFIDPRGRGFWLGYSANFVDGWNGASVKMNPIGSGYGFAMQQVLFAQGNLDQATVLERANPLLSKSNLARSATVSASSVHAGYTVGGAVDGAVSGFPKDPSMEWASSGETEGAWLRLSWKESHRIDRVWLFDRSNTFDQITAGQLTFNDGSTLDVGSLPDAATQGKEVEFTARSVTWIEFKVTKTKPGSMNIGLAEFGAFEVEAATGIADRKGVEVGGHPRFSSLEIGGHNALGRAKKTRALR